jgi:hypothetical protein
VERADGRPPFTSDDELLDDHAEVLACSDLAGVLVAIFLEPSVTSLPDEEDREFKGVPPRQVRLTEPGSGESDDTVERELYRRTRRRDAALPSSASGSSVHLRANSIS